MPFCMKNMPAACRSFDACFSGSRKPVFSASLPSFSLMKPLIVSKRPMIGLPPSAAYAATWAVSGQQVTCVQNSTM